MNRHLTMNHLHLGCGESLAQLLPDLPAQQPAAEPVQLRHALHVQPGRSAQTVRTPHKGEGRR